MRPLAAIDRPHEVGGIPLPALLQNGVVVQEQQPGEAGATGARQHLVASASAALHELRAGLVGNRAGAVGGAAVDHDHLAHYPLDRRRYQGGKRLSQPGFGVSVGMITEIIRGRVSVFIAAAL